MNLITRKHVHPCLRLLILVVCMLTQVTASAQPISSNMDEKTKSMQHLEAIKDGTLIFILRSDHQQLDVYEKLIESPTASPSAKKRAEKLRNTTLVERAMFSTDFAAAIYAHYTFSDFRIMYDYDVRAYRAGEDVLFLNEACEPDPSIKPPTGTRYFAREQYINPQEGARVLGYVILDDDMQALKYPVPSVKITLFAIAQLFATNSMGYRKGAKIVQRLDHMLKKRLNDMAYLKTE